MRGHKLRCITLLLSCPHDINSPSSTRFLRLAYHLFLTSLSLRPGSILAIFAQRLPNLARCATISFSSVSVHARLFRSGLRWLCHRSRHCLPTRPGKNLPMKLHLVRPCFLTRAVRAASSSFVQLPFPFTMVPFFSSTSRQCVWHCASVLSVPTSWQIFFLYKCRERLGCVGLVLVKENYQKDMMGKIENLRSENIN